MIEKDSLRSRKRTRTDDQEVKKKKQKVILNTCTNAQLDTNLEAHSREASPLPNFNYGPRLEEFSTTQPVVQPALTQPPVIQPTVTQPTVMQPTVTQPTVMQPGLSRVIHYVPNMVLNIQPSSQPDCSPPPQPASQSASRTTAKKPRKRGPKPKPVDVEKNEQIECCSIKYVCSDDLNVNDGLNNWPDTLPNNSIIGLGKTIFKHQVNYLYSLDLLS
jgi:hypothetical protein